MPNLLIFLPCEKVIISSRSEGGDNSASVIAVLEGLHFTKEPPPLRKDDDVTGIPMQWAIFTLWEHGPGEEGSEFEQICTLDSPNGKELLRASIKFRFTKLRNRNTITIVGMPIDGPGKYNLRLFLADAKTPEILIEKASFPILISIATPTEKPSASPGPVS